MIMGYGETGREGERRAGVAIKKGVLCVCGREGERCVCR